MPTTQPDPVPPDVEEEEPKDAEERETHNDRASRVDPDHAPLDYEFDVDADDDAREDENQDPDFIEGE